MTRAGDDRRRQILDRAMQLASVEGLAGVSIGRLAEETGISKSGLAGLFGSKTELQLATVEAAAEVFKDRVFRPTRGERGLPRLRRLLDAWIDYLDTFEGGCFFTAAAWEFDGRPGQVRDAIRTLIKGAVEAIREEIRIAQKCGELGSDIDDRQLAWELHGFLLEANLEQQLFADRSAHARARRALRERLDRAEASAKQEDHV
ncbi:MAG TPA: TetR/AcrR family transcriptional regulator [Acidimicrobiales bacterium]|nr:TetR/AcrR family transcriptional regulator [Acidimicrobiales bacterium]